jgi:hypothetical protein
MSSESTRHSSQDHLQFDRAVQSEAPNAGGLTCAICTTPLRTEYYHVAEQPACAACKDTARRENQKAETQRRHPGILARSFGFGLVAAIAGAILYFAVIAITGWEIGLVAIVIGFMVGAAVRKGSGNAGGRRFQWLAVILTYFAVGLAYTPLAFKSFAEGGSPTDVVADSTGTGGTTAANDTAAIATQPTNPASTAAQDTSASAPSMAVALGFTFLFIFALPVMYVVGSMPSGLISAIIILVGMQQAWKMTAKADVPITGPYKLGQGAPTA